MASNDFYSNYFLQTCINAHQRLTFPLSRALPRLGHLAVGLEVTLTKLGPTVVPEVTTPGLLVPDAESHSATTLRSTTIVGVNLMTMDSPTVSFLLFKHALNALHAKVSLDFLSSTSEKQLYEPFISAGEAEASRSSSGISSCCLWIFFVFPHTLDEK